MESKDQLDPLDQLEPLGNKDPLDLVVGGLSTPGGGRAPVLKWGVLSWSTQGLPEELITTREVVEQITSACQRTQSTVLPSRTDLEYKDMLMCMGQSMRYQFQELELIIIMCPVLCANYLQDRKC